MTATELAAIIANTRTLLLPQIAAELRAAIDRADFRCTVDVARYDRLAKVHWTIDNVLPMRVEVEAWVWRSVSGSIEMSNTSAVDIVRAEFVSGSHSWLLDECKPFQDVGRVLLTRTIGAVEEKFPQAIDAELESVLHGDNRAS